MRRLAHRVKSRASDGPNCNKKRTRSNQKNRRKGKAMLNLTQDQEKTIDILERNGWEIGHISYQGWVNMIKSKGCSTWMGQVDPNGTVNGEDIRDFLGSKRS